MIELKLIQDSDAASFQGSSYDLRLGDWHCVTRQGKWKPLWIGIQRQEFDLRNRKAPPFIEEADAPERRLTIEPYGAAMIQLQETVDTRDCLVNRGVMVCGHFDLRLRMVRRGIICQQATQVEPCYTGKLFCYLFNQTGKHVHIPRLDRVATIEFSYASCITFCDPEKRKQLVVHFDARAARYQKDYARHFCGAFGIEDVRYFIAKEDDPDRLPEHAGLQELDVKVGSVERSVNARLDAILGEICPEVKRQVEVIRGELAARRQYLVSLVAIGVVLLGMALLVAFVARNVREIVQLAPVALDVKSNVAGIKTDLSGVTNSLPGIHTEVRTLEAQVGKVTNAVERARQRQDTGTP